MTEAFGKRWGNHSSFKLGAMDRSGFATFTVNHFNGPVTYSSEGFLECNLDALNPDFVALLQGTSTASTTASLPAAGAGLGTGTDAIEGASSINPFVKGPFSGKAIATQAHPKSEDTIVAVQQPVKPMCAPSTRRKGTMRCMPLGMAPPQPPSPRKIGMTKMLLSTAIPVPAVQVRVEQEHPVLQANSVLCSIHYLTHFPRHKRGTYSA